MRVAVVVPCFDDGATIGEAVASVRAAPEPVELVVVDDGSTDPATLAVLGGLEREGARVVHQPNAGLPAARRAGVAASTAPYVFPLDADDLAVPEQLPRMADLLDAHPEAGVCYGDFSTFDERGEIVRATPSWLDPFRLAHTNELPVSALFRRSLLEELGGWRDIRWGYEDWDLWLTLAERGVRSVHAGAGNVTYRRRLHGERMLTQTKRHHRELYAILRERHPGIWGRMAEHRRRSDLSRARKLLYPVVYGARPRFAWEPRVKALLDRLGVWTMRR